MRLLLLALAISYAGSIAAQPSAPDTTLPVVSVVATRALGHYWEGIRQYLAIRLGVKGASMPAPTVNPSASKS